MAITDPFVLPGDVMLMPVAELPENVREKVNYKEGDFAITRPNVRTPSKIVDAHAAELLKEFQTAKTIVQAILDYSDTKGGDPHQALTEALPLLKNFIDSHLLVSPESPEAERILPTLSVGDSFDEFEIRQAVQILEDTELYQARSAQSEIDVALKILRDTDRPDLHSAFEREASVLRHLDGKVNPRLIKTGVWESRPFLAIEWFDASPVLLVADELRQFSLNGAEPEDARGAQERLQTLLVSLVENYAHLHEQGVVHSDVHPNNLLVSDAGEIKILDFGLARFNDTTHPLSIAQRGGVGFYFEPECAQAALLGKRIPPSSMVGEQYAVAAVAYQLLTGANHIDFSLQQEEMLRQISEAEPLPFSEHGAVDWPELEQALARALSRDPQRRFASLRDFADTLRSLPPPKTLTAKGVFDVTDPPTETNSWAMNRPPLERPGELHESFIQSVIQRLQADGEMFHSGIGEGHILPTGSADYGTAGIALGLLRLASNRDDPQLLALADLWITKTLSQASEESAFYNDKLELTRENVSEISLHHMVNGVYLVRALVSGAFGDAMAQQAAIQAFIAASRAETDNLDLTLGRSSVLHGCSLLVENARHCRFVDVSPLLEFGDQVMHSIWDKVGTFAPVPESTEISYLGMAHGWAGVLYAALRWCQVKAETTNEEASAIVPVEVQQRLNELAQCAMPAGRSLLWLWQNRKGGDFSSGDNGFMPGWCNGSAGHVFLWTLAHRVLAHPGSLDLARKTAWGLWDQTCHFNNLCCGAGGSSYALLNLYRLTEDKNWLSRARQLGHRVATTKEPPSEHETDINSLYKGDIGSMVLLDDLAHPETARMPLFE